MRRALVTLVSKNFEPGFYVLLKSLVDHNPWFNIPVIVFSLDTLSDDFVSNYKSIYSNVILKKINFSPYQKIDKENTTRQYMRNYCKFELFTLSEYHFVVFFDSDILIRSDIEDLFTFYYKKHNFCAVKDDSLPRFNSGVMVVRNELLSTKVRDKLITLAKSGDFSHADQNVLNVFIGNDYYKLPHWYNTLKSDFRSYGSWITRVKILHYISKKPWETYDPEIHYSGNLECERIDKYWWDVYNRLPFLNNKET